LPRPHSRDWFLRLDRIYRFGWLFNINLSRTIHYVQISFRSFGVRYFLLIFLQWRCLADGEWPNDDTLSNGLSEFPCRNIMRMPRITGYSMLHRFWTRCFRLDVLFFVFPALMTNDRLNLFIVRYWRGHRFSRLSSSN